MVNRVNVDAARR